MRLTNGNRLTVNDVATAIVAFIAGTWLALHLLGLIG